MLHELEPEDQNEMERQLRERRPTGNNRTELTQLMDATRTVRRQWIRKDKPDITTILKRYPRFLEMNEVVAAEYEAIHPDCLNLRTELSKCRDKILECAKEKAVNNLDLQDILGGIGDGYDEEIKSIASICALPFLLPTPPKRGIKKPKVDPRIILEKLLYCEAKENESANCIIETLKERNVTQPVLFQCSGDYFIKVDNQAMPVTTPSCFADCVELLFQTYWVFNIDYPSELKYVYGFFEKLVNIKTTVGGSSQLYEFHRKICIKG